MFGIRATNKFVVIGSNADSVDQWVRLLQETGLPVVKGHLHQGSISPSKFICAILLDPGLDTEGNPSPDYRSLLENFDDSNFFVISDDQRWKQVQDMQPGVHFISPQSHPYEAARFMVEKLNYSFTGNAPAYAFSFFQF